MSKLTDARWAYTTHYIDTLSRPQGEWLQGLESAMRDHGLPDISVGASVGMLLEILVSSTNAQCALEIGTLGGYSAAWILRALKPEGILHTIEREPTYAAFSKEWLDTLGFQDKYTLHVEDALDTIPRLGQTLGDGSVDFVFMDSDKHQYERIVPLVRNLIRPGGLLVADNALGTGDFWIDQEGHTEREALHRFNEQVFGLPDFQACLLPLRQGVLVARRIVPTTE